VVPVVLWYLSNILCPHLYEYSCYHGHHIDTHILVEVVPMQVVVLEHIGPAQVGPELESKLE
jgi:hypothetical protein